MSEQVLVIEGPLTMMQAHRQVSLGRDYARRGDFTIDFQHVTESDSVALALLLDWLRSARAAGHRMRLRNLPKGLESLAVLYGIAELLEIEP